MSKATEQFKNLMESDRGEASAYASAGPDDQVFLPITRGGFEAMVFEACKLVGLEVSDPNRNVAVGFLHSLGRGTAKCSIRAMSDAIWSTLSNHTSYTIDQEIKIQANKELREEQEKAAAAKKEIEKNVTLSRQVERAKLRQAKADKRAEKTAKRLGKSAPESASNEQQA